MERTSMCFCDVKDEISACRGTNCSKNTGLPRLLFDVILSRQPLNVTDTRTLHMIEDTYGRAF